MKNLFRWFLYNSFYIKLLRRVYGFLMVFIYPAVDGEKKQEVPLLSSTKFSSQSPPPDLYLLADEEEEPLSPEEAQLVTDP